MIPFRIRRNAGKRLAQKLFHYANAPDVIMLALPRGGIPEKYELAFGAIVFGGIRVLNEDYPGIRSP